MSVRNAEANWTGSLKTGQGRFKLGSGACEGSFSFTTRFEETPGSNPEELIGAAHASCFSMALSHLLGEAGHAPESIRTQARVHIERLPDGFKITRIELETTAKVPGMDENAFLEKANAAKIGCPVSKALTGTEIILQARLENG